MSEPKPIDVYIIHKADDPVSVRASLGGSPSAGFYITYRGDREQILAMLHMVAQAFTIYQKFPENAIDETIALPLIEK